MDFDIFMNTIKTVTSVPEDTLDKNLMNAVMFADAGVKATFFSDKQPDTYLVYKKDEVDGKFSDLSVIYLSFVIGITSSFDFYKTVNVRSDAGVKQWFALYSSSVGRYMAADYLRGLVKNSNTGILDDAAGTAKAIADKAASDRFFTDFMVECDTLGSTLPVIAFLTFLESIDDGGAQLDRVVSAWKNNVMWAKVPDYRSYAWLDASAHYFDLNNTGFNDVAAAVLTAVSRTSTTQSSSTRSGPGGTAYTHAVTTTIYGQDVLTWLDSANGPVRFNNRSGESPSNTTGGTSGGGSGCMIAGTSILVAGGLRKPIESLVEFDRVVSGNGVLSTCSGEIVTSRRMTDLYSVNEDAPFMSLEHAVMTQRGWCSLHPTLSQQLNPGIRIAHLQEGDLIWKVSEIKKGKVKYTTVPVTRINITRYVMGQAPVGYVFHLKDGHNTYHANDYCCLSGYPQVTTQLIAANMLSNMTPAEQLRFKTGLDVFSPLLEKAIGQGPVEAIKNILKDPVKAATTAGHTNIHGVISRARNYRELVVPSMIVQPRAGSRDLPPDFTNLAIIRGQLLINGNPVASCVKDNHICWHRKNGRLESGMIRLHHNGLLGEGIVTRGKERFLFTAAVMVDYSTNYTDSTGAKNWVGFEMGFEPGTDGSMHAVGQLVIQGDQKKTTELQKHSTVAFSIDNAYGQSELHAGIQFDSVYCSFGGSQFIAAEIDFSMDYTTFSGTLFEYDSSASDNRGAGHSLSGVCTTSVSGMLAKVAAFMAGNTPNLSLLSSGTPAIRSSMQKAVALTAEDDLSVNALFTLPTPDMQNVHQLAFSKLKSLMLYAMDESWLTWFNQTKPVVGSEISQSDVALLQDKDIYAFLATQFPIGYLTQAFSQSDDPKIKSKFDNMIGWIPKMQYFWKGSDADTCFAKSKGYNKAMNSLLASAFTDSVSGFDAYLQDNPSGWAAQLYNHCTTQATLLGLAVQSSVDGRARLTQLSSMLQALDATTLVTVGASTKLTYAQALYQRVIDLNLNNVLADSITADNTVLQDFLIEFFKQYFNSLISGGPWTDNVLASAKEDMETLMGDFNAANAAELVDAMNKVVTSAVTIMATDAFKKLPMAARLQKWVTENPNSVKNIGKIGTVLTIAVYGFAFYQTITTLMKWDELTPAQKTQAVANLLDTTASVFNDFSRYKAAQTIATPNADVEDLIDASTQVSDKMGDLSVIEMTNMVADSTGMGTGTSALAEAGAEIGIAVQETGDIAQVASRWTQIAKITDVAAKGLTVVALAASCVVGGFDIANDFKNGQPASIKTMDILEEAANGVAFLAIGGEGIAALAGIEVCSAIPVIGAVAAIAGVAFAFAEMFIHRDPPPTPEETFVDDQSAVFLAMLPLPTQAWLDKQANLNKHLNTAG